MSVNTDRYRPATLVVGRLELSPDSYRACLRGRPVPLTPSQVDLLAALVTKRDRVVTREELAAAAHIDAGSVYVALSAMRRQLGRGFVRNVRNRGWILEPHAFD